MYESSTDRGLLRLQIRRSGLSQARFAVEVLRRNERTVRRWISGESPMPKEVLDFLSAPRKAPWP